MKTKDLGNRCSSVGESAENSRDEGQETFLARCQVFSSLESKQSRLERGKTPKECLPDQNEIDRLPEVFELI